MMRSLPLKQDATDARKENEPTAALANGLSKSSTHLLVFTLGKLKANAESTISERLLAAFANCEVFDSTIPQAMKIIAHGTVVLDGTKFVILEGVEGFDIEIPEVNCESTHMVGSDMHNILPKPRNFLSKIILTVAKCLLDPLFLLVINIQ